MLCKKLLEGMKKHFLKMLNFLNKHYFNMPHVILLMKCFYKKYKIVCNTARTK